MPIPDDITGPQYYTQRRNTLLKGIKPDLIRKAWFTLAHLLLEEDSVVLDMGCGEGTLTYAMAAMNPHVTFIGLDKDKRKINKAMELYKLSNLSFRIGDISGDIFEEESVDAIINAYILHEVFSNARYNDQIVSDTLRKHFRILKKGGVMFIQDYASPPADEFVLMEMPDVQSTGTDLARLSEADLLVWYAEHARPKQDSGCGGFFLEELPERFPNTRLFRLPHKWAYEFVMRKDDRKHWESALPLEYTFFTVQEFRKELRALGARVQYSGPYWDEDFINDKFEGKFRLYEDNGTPLGDPPTCFIAVAYKLAERKSLNIEERRPSNINSGAFKITAMRDQHSGAVKDVVRRDLEVSEILPYRVDEDGRLRIYLHDGMARSITNAVPRGGVNIDGRIWSGHMVEAISVDGPAIRTLKELDHKHTVLFCRDFLGLKPQSGHIMEKGPSHYPAPDYIDEYIHTYYLNVERARGPITPKSLVGAEKFQGKGVVREMDAQQILNAITVGMIPHARLEMQILHLFQKLGIKAETWTDKHISLQVNKITNKSNLNDLLRLLGENDTRFREIKGTAGQLRPVHSIFVEEGQSRGAMSGLSAENVDFIVHDSMTINTAVVLPLTKDIRNDVHAGFLLEHLPVPQRHEGNGLTISAPSFNIPAEITDQKLLKRFIAEQFGVLPSMVFKLGESYFAHVGMTPQRIYPFAVAIPQGTMKNPGIQFLPFYQFMLLRKLISKQPHFMLTIARAYRYFNDALRMDAKQEVRAIVKQRFEGLQPEWSIPLHFDNLEDLKEKRERELEKHAHPAAPPPPAPESPEMHAPEIPREEPEEAPLPAPPHAPHKKHVPFHAQFPNAPPPPPVIAPDYTAEEIGEEVMNYEHELEAFLDLVEKTAAQTPKPER